jgi:hypothetical protein
MMSYYLIYLSFLLIIGTVGVGTLFVVTRKFKLTFFESILFALFGGYIISITIFSIIQTGFKTVNIFYILLLLFALWQVLKMPARQEIEKTNTKLKHVLLLIGSSCFFYGLAYYSAYNPGGFIPFNYIDSDYILYAKIAKYISITGQENGYNHLNLLDSYYNGPEPYHFFDLWGSSLVHYLFGVNHYLGLKLIVYPTFYFLVFIGVICLFQKLSSIKIFLALLIIWFGGFFLVIPELQSIKYLQSIGGITTNLLNPGLYKLSYFYVFILSAYLLYKKEHFGLAIICLLGLIIANVITAPTILTALFLVIILSFRLKMITKKECYTYLFYLVALSVSLVAFYGITKTERAGLAGAEITSPLALIQESFSTQNLKTQRNIILSSVIYLSILYFPVLFLLFHNRALIRIKNLALVFIITSVLISISIWALLFNELNSSQVFYNISTSLINVSAFVLIVASLNNGVLSIRAASKAGWVLNILIALTIVINIINSTNKIHTHHFETHSYEYLKKIYETVPTNELIATLKAPNEMEEMHSKYNAVYPLGNYLFLFDRNINSVNIGDLDTPIDTTSKMNRNRSYKAIRDGLFFRFSQLDENKSLNRDDLTIKFLDEFNIKFIIASKDVEVPQILSMNVKSMIADSVSGEKFIELN